MSFYKILEDRYGKDRIGTFKKIMPECIVEIDGEECFSLYSFGFEIQCLKDDSLNHLYFSRLEDFINNKRQLLTEKAYKIDGLNSRFIDYIREAWNSYCYTDKL